MTAGYPVGGTYYCDSCAYKRKWFWPTLTRLFRKCEHCGQERTCNHE